MRILIIISLSLCVYLILLNYKYSKKLKFNKTEDFKINKVTYKSEGNNIISSNKCYLPLDKSTNRIIHLIITRFLVEFFNKFDFEKKIYAKNEINFFIIRMNILLMQIEL